MSLREPALFNRRARPCASLGGPDDVSLSTNEAETEWQNGRLVLGAGRISIQSTKMSMPAAFESFLVHRSSAKIIETVAAHKKVSSIQR